MAKQFKSVLWLTIFALCPVFASGETAKLPKVTLPSKEPTAPSLWTARGRIATLKKLCRRAPRKGQLASYKKWVDKQWEKILKGAQPDQKARLAKTAGLLAALGQGGAPKAAGSYGKVALEAIASVKPRQPRKLLGGAGVINVLQDSGRLQSLAEGYDLCRAAAVDSTLSGRAVARLANWAEALRGDVQLTGAFGIPGHRDNWGVKAGAALVTVALTLAEHGKARLWLAFGERLIQESFDRVLITGGWWGEGPHYLNYSLNNLLSTAYHVKNAGQADWFPTLRPLIWTALKMRQPDGSSAAFEEGISVVLPFELVAPAYPRDAAVLRWAWQQSAKSAGSYENQQVHSITRFLLVDHTLSSREPELSPTQFIAGDTHAHVLRSSWSRKALQLTMLTARDFQSRTMVASRHNMQNPLDVTLFGNGQLMLVPGTGGPTITRSANRAYYLEPSSKNIPLINGSAPFLTDGKAMRSRFQFDSQGSSKRERGFFDCAQSIVAPFGDASEVRRAVALVDESYFVVTTSFKGAADQQLSTPWRGRGQRRELAQSEHFVNVQWSYKDTVLTGAFTASRVQAMTRPKAFFAPRWNKEERLAALGLAIKGREGRMLAGFQITAKAAPAYQWSASKDGGSSLKLVGPGFEDFIYCGEASGAVDFGNGVVLSGELVVLRQCKAKIKSLGLMNTRQFSRGGFQFTMDSAAVVVIRCDKKRTRISVSGPDNKPWSLTAGPFPQINRALRYKAFLNGRKLGKTFFKKRGQMLEFKSVRGSGEIEVKR
jgi:hypothetical protein